MTDSRSNIHKGEGGGRGEVNRSLQRHGTHETQHTGLEITQTSSDTNPSNMLGDTSRLVGRRTSAADPTRTGRGRE